MILYLSFSHLRISRLLVERRKLSSGSRPVPFNNSVARHLPPKVPLDHGQSKCKGVLIEIIMASVKKQEEYRHNWLMSLN
jgi:hypothetical protein